MWRVNKSTIVLLLVGIFVSVYLAKFLQIFCTHATNVDYRYKKTPLRIIGDSEEHLIWFMQISDIHISIFWDPMRIVQFKEFCDYTVKAIKPTVVLATGDLTDAKTSNGMGSRQFKEEWEMYRTIIIDTGVTKQTTWLDIRGNHDNFNVASQLSSQHFFPNYSVQGARHRRSYMHQVKFPQSADTVTFIGVDACLEPGPRIPFNFIGLVDQSEMDHLNIMLKLARINSSATIWFGHFPTSCILSTANESVLHLIGKDEHALAYVSGHLHQLGGVVPRMYTFQRSARVLELELADWKENRRYRLMAIDHGLLSFIDLEHRQWPVALVTNPKHCLFRNPTKESWQSIRESTHIRILAFSLAPITRVAIRIDKETRWKEAKHIGSGAWSSTQSPLYVIKWEPLMYSLGIHTIEVFVKDADGRERTYSQPFQLDDANYLSFDMMARISLMTKATSVFRGVFFGMVLILILPLAMARLMHHCMIHNKLCRRTPLYRRGCLRLWWRKMWLLSIVDRLFWPLLLYPVYLSVGPWCVGYLIENHLGVIFAWGIYIYHSFLPGSFTYVYGFIQLVTFQLPLTMLVAHGVDLRFQMTILRPERKRSRLIGVVSLHLPFLIMFCFQVAMAYQFWFAYGITAFMLAPIRTWSLVMALTLWYQSFNFPTTCFNKVSGIWYTANTHKDSIMASAPSSSLDKYELSIDERKKP